MLNQEIDKYKKVVLMVLLRLTIMAGFIFITLNYKRGLFVFATVELVTIFVIILIYFSVRKTENQKTIEHYSLAYTLIFLSVMMLAFSTNGISKSMFIWAFTIPMLSYLLLGIRKGIVVTVFYYSLSIILLLKNINFDEVENVTLANIFVAAIGFWGLAHTYEKANLLAKQKLQKMAIYDELTQLHNRKMLNQIFDKAVIHAQANNQQISFVSLDLDLFKEINDQFGHVIGDEVLMGFSKILKENIPSQAGAFRLGGEEFAIIYPCDSLLQAKDLAEIIRQKTENFSIMLPNNVVKITVSAGIAIGNPEDVNMTNLLKQSDKRLYNAKSNGRNRVSINH